VNTVSPLPVVRLRPGREGPSRGRHPWIFSGAVGSTHGDPADGDEVRVESSGGQFVCRGLWNSRSQIVVRGYRWEDLPIDEPFLRHRIRSALEYRRLLARAGRIPLPGADPSSALRLVFSEGDGLSGMTVDRYGEWLSVQFTSLALARRMDLLLDLLEEEVRPRGILLRTEKGIGEEEGLVLRDGLLRGEDPPAALELDEDGLRLRVDLRTGQKTGFYLDQRDNRRLAGSLAAGRTAADVCCYTGGFALSMARAGATSVVGVDASASALELAAANARANDLEARVTFQRSDALRWLREEGERGRRYDLVVLDPPRFARSRRGIAVRAPGVRAPERGGGALSWSPGGSSSPAAVRGGSPGTTSWRCWRAWRNAPVAPCGSWRWGAGPGPPGLGLLPGERLPQGRGGGGGMTGGGGRPAAPPPPGTIRYVRRRESVDREGHPDGQRLPVPQGRCEPEGEIPPKATSAPRSMAKPRSRLSRRGSGHRGRRPGRGGGRSRG
jgi:23S rRNA (cytosine1962-C5)-methyltransferase